MEVVLSTPRGFCAGVVRAVDVVELCLERFGSPIYVRREIVHNPHVVSDLKSKGAIFVEELEELPKGQRVVFSAHGVSPAVVAAAGAWPDEAWLAVDQWGRPLVIIWAALASRGKTTSSVAST